MEHLVETLLPAHDEARKDQPSMALEVLEDSHVLGKRMVYATLRASGFDLKDYGRMEASGLVAREM
jgi:methanogenic corrinoid protein MtbC1